MKAKVLLLALMIGSACASTPPRAGGAPSPTPNRVIVSAPPPSPVPSATPTPPSLLATLNCRIAVSTGNPGSGGFVAIPGGQFTADKASDVDLPGQSGASGLSYSVALRKWLPVPRSWITPDGKRYVYWNWQQGTLEVVDAATNTQTAAQELARMAAELQRLVGEFKLGGGRGEAEPTRGQVPGTRLASNDRVQPGLVARLQ